MDIITEEVVEETWKETGGFSPKRAKKEMANVGKRQPNLLAFVAEFIQDLNAAFLTAICYEVCN